MIVANILAVGIAGLLPHALPAFAEPARAAAGKRIPDSEQALWPAPRLALEEVPAPRVPADKSLPQPAAWPELRHERRLRFLVIANLRTAMAPYQRIARRCNADLDFRFYATGGLTPKGIQDGVPRIHTLAHTNDEYIEAKDNPSASEVGARMLDQIKAALAAAPNRYDVVFLNQAVPEFAGLLENNMRRGGVWVVCDHSFPSAESPYAPLWPAKRHSDKKSWHSGGAERTNASTLMGLPLERLRGHRYMHISLPLGDDEAAQGPGEVQTLAQGASGAAYVRRIGAGTLLLVPTGPFSRTSNAVELDHRRYDHDDIWLRYWDQLLHDLANGPSALPVMADLSTGPKEAPPGADYTFQGELFNRTDRTRSVVVSSHVVSPSGEVIYKSDPEPVELAGGEKRPWPVTVPVPAAWREGMYQAFFTVGDPDQRRQIHQALRYIPVTGSVQLKLTSDRPGYQIGERAAFELAASSASPWSGTIRFGVYDFRGRLLAAETESAVLGVEPKKTTFGWTCEDHGVRMNAVWAVVTAVKDGEVWGRDVRKVYKHERWDMHKEYQWSVWAETAGKSPCLVPQAMRLMAHAGFNALGYPSGGKELYYPAERWGWRIYDEGVGTNTWSPEIDAVTDAQIEQSLREGRRREDATLRSAALCLASVGEEAGFKHGWGKTYYWQTPIAPPVACQAFQRFLKEKYPDLQTLNAAWRTRFDSWDEIKLTKEFSGRNTHIGADGWAHPKESPLGDGVERTTAAPYNDTRAFYGWYYNKVVKAALKILREEINPVPLTMASAPASAIFDPPSVDVRLAGGSSWRESQQWSLSANAAAPGFGMTWGHFDWPVAQENAIWAFVISRSGHNDYWVDVPLNFNADMTHTRASFAIRRWRQRTAHAERLLLDAQPSDSEVAVLRPNGTHAPWESRFAQEMADTVMVSLNQGGFGFSGVDWDDLSQYKVIFAVFRSALSAEQVQALTRYVENGGTLVFTPRFASQTEHNVPIGGSPGFGLASKWALKVVERDERVSKRDMRQMDEAPLNGLGAVFEGLRLQTPQALVEKVDAPGWRSLAQYADQTPALLERPWGNGRLVFLNAAYRAHKYIQWVTPTDEARQGFYRLVEQICTDAGARRRFRLEGHLPELLHTAVLDWTDRTGCIRYVVARTHGQTVWTSTQLNWLDSHRVCYDVYGGDPRKPAPVYGKQTQLHLRPGDGRLFAFTETPVQTVNVSAEPARVTAGDPIRVSVEILDAQGNPVPGAFPLEVQVSNAAGEIPAMRRDLSLASGDHLVLRTALNDPAGRWTVAVRDGISRQIGQAGVEVTAPQPEPQAPAFLAWGQPSELCAPSRPPTREFVDELKQLADVYRRDRSDETWMTKQWVGAHYSYFGGNRHEVLRKLAQVDWREYSDALRTAVEDGAELILVGEDLGLDPASGLPVCPYQEPTQIEAVIEAMQGAEWCGLSADGEIVRAELGEGSVVLSRCTPDGASSTWGYARHWLSQFHDALDGTPAHRRIPAPDARSLRQWLVGEGAIVPGPRTVRWRGGWEGGSERRPVWRDTSWKQSFNSADQTTGPVFVLRLPPTGQVHRVVVELAAESERPVQIDIGADGSVEGTCAGAQAHDGAAAVAWTRAIAQYLQWTEKACGGAARDLNGWRLVPIRFRADVPFQVDVQSVDAQME